MSYTPEVLTQIIAAGMTAADNANIVVVNITYDSDTNKFTADKPISSMLEALDDGRLVIGIFTNWHSLGQITSYEYDNTDYVQLTGDVVIPDDNQLMLYYIDGYADEQDGDTWELTPIYYTLTPAN